MGLSDLVESKPAQWARYHLLPPLTMVLFTGVVQVLAETGNPTKPFQVSNLLGNAFAWKVISSIIAWALIWLWIPGKEFRGPKTYFGYVPVYKANGELYYFFSLATFGLLAYWKPTLCVAIYNNMGPILGGLNLVAFLFCIYLLVSAKMKTKEEDTYLNENTFPVLHEFYRGMELHPRLFGVDVKQLTNCRIGLMMWQLLVINHFIAACHLHGVNYGHLTCTILQTVYLYKFYRWETGYFDTLDITLDRAGYYICWGCLVWVPAFYTYSSYYFVHHVPYAGAGPAVFILLVGLFAIFYNYQVDRHKELFRANSEVQLWGKPAEFIVAAYKMADGTKKQTKLLCSGWWGVARKINYTFELLAAFCWCAAAGAMFSFWPFLYFFFLVGLLVHRIFRDEDKLRVKYGPAWKQYCQRVPYRMIPYIF